MYRDIYEVSTRKRAGPRRQDRKDIIYIYDPTLTTRVQ
jgi:hypothetical protein